MTLDEAIKHAEEIAEENDKQFKNCPMKYDGAYTNNGKTACKCAEEHRQLAEWLKDYKRLLEQQPITTTNNDEPITVIYPTIVCDDAISREWLKTAIHNFYYGLKHTPTEEDIQAYIDVAPSVTQKSGKWIELPKALNLNENPCKCSECGHILSFMNYYPKSNYCPSCGCRMVEPQERSDKE